MAKPRDPPDKRARAVDSGHRSSRSGVAGFFVALGALFRPEQGEVPVLQTLSGMPRAATAQRTALAEAQSSPEAHPLRRPAGSAGRWKQQLAEAKQAWPLLSVDELVATDGHLQKLAGLVQERYALSHEVAEQQVRRFLGLPVQPGRM